MRRKQDKYTMYLQAKQQQTGHVTNRQLETILAAACLRYLVNLEELSFVLGLAQEILVTYRTTMRLALNYSVEILKDLEHKLEQNDISFQNTKQIKDTVNEAQEVITGISFPLE